MGTLARGAPWRSAVAQPVAARHSRGALHKGTHVILLVHDLDVRVVHAATAELLRELTIDPRRDYQPTGRPPEPTRKN